MSWLEIWAMLQVLGIVVPVVLVTCFVAYFLIRDAVIQWKCKHENYRENMACHAICTHCGKDLGFIDTVRKQKAAK